MASLTSFSCTAGGTTTAMDLLTRQRMAQQKINQTRSINPTSPASMAHHQSRKNVIAPAGFWLSVGAKGPPGSVGDPSGGGWRRDKQETCDGKVCIRKLCLQQTIERLWL